MTLYLKQQHKFITLVLRSTVIHIQIVIEINQLISHSIKYQNILKRAHQIFSKFQNDVFLLLPLEFLKRLFSFQNSCQIIFL